MTPELAKTVHLLQDLIAFPTVSKDSNYDCTMYLAKQLEAVGAEVEIYPDATGAKANLFATLGPKVDGGIVLSGHTDVVPTADQAWSSDPFEMRQTADAVYGRGTCDMKGFVAATVAMAPYFAQHIKNRPVHFAFTHDEESGCYGAQALMKTLQASGLKPAIALVGEPTSMKIIEGHKGCYEYTTRFTGLAGHGSEPDSGVNCIEYAARYVARILELKEALRARAPADSQFFPPWTTINTGRLEGGTAHNVIPSQSLVAWEMRPVQASDADFVKSELDTFCQTVLLPEMRRVFPDAAIETEIIAEIDGLLPMKDNAARDLLMALTGANDTDLVAFGTEAGFFQGLGMATVVCGPGSIEQAHKADEFITLDQLQQCLDMLHKLGPRLATD